MLQPIFLPPAAVSIPRTEVPMEAIIGVHVRPPPSQRDFGCRKCLLHSVRVTVAHAAPLFFLDMCLAIRGRLRRRRLHRTIALDLYDSRRHPLSGNTTPLLDTPVNRYELRSSVDATRVATRGALVRLSRDGLSLIFGRKLDSRAKRYSRGR